MGSPCFHEVNEGETEESDARRATLSCSRAGRRPASEWTIEVEPRTRFGRMSRSRFRLNRPLGRATRGASSSSYPSNVRQATFRPKSAGRYNLLRSSSVDPVSPFVKGDSSTTIATQELEEEAGRMPSGPLRAIEQAIKTKGPRRIASLSLATSIGKTGIPGPRGPSSRENSPRASTWKAGVVPSTSHVDS